MTAFSWAWDRQERDSLLRTSNSFLLELLLFFELLEAPLFALEFDSPLLFPYCLQPIFPTYSLFFLLLSSALPPP